MYLTNTFVEKSFPYFLGLTFLGSPYRPSPKGLKRSSFGESLWRRCSRLDRPCWDTEVQHKGPKKTSLLTLFVNIWQLDQTYQNSGLWFFLFKWHLLDCWLCSFMNIHQLHSSSCTPENRCSGSTPLTESLQTIADHCKGDVFLWSCVGSVLLKCSLCWLIVANIKPYQNSFGFLDTST